MEAGYGFATREYAVAQLLRSEHKWKAWRKEWWMMC